MLIFLPTLERAWLPATSLHQPHHRTFRPVWQLPNVEDVKQFKDLTITYEAPSGATLYVSTDLPAQIIALRRTISLPSGTGRCTDTFPLDDPSLLEGKLIKFKVESTDKVILYSGFVRFRRVGTYIDGAAGDKWETQPLSLEG